MERKKIVNVFLKEALRLADLGFKVLPLRPGDKRPAVEHGVHDASSDPEVITEWWTRMPDANLAISCEGLLVVDIDDPSTGWPGDDSKANDLSTCPLQQTPRKGHHRVMRLPPGKIFGNTTSKLAERIDTRSMGGYVLVAPSVIGGERYEWLQPIESYDDIPLVFDWLAEELGRIQTTGGYNGTGDEFLGDRPIPDGEQNDTLTRIAGWLRLHGFSQGQIEAALVKISEERCVDAQGQPYPHPLERIKKIAWSVSRYEADVFRVAAMEDAPPDRAEEEHPDPGKFPPELIDEAPGLLQDVLKHTLATSPRPQPVFALAGALGLMSTLTGRKIRDKSNLRTNMILLVAGKSGSGKDRARQVNREILTAIGADELIGSEEVQSGNGVYTIARTQPVSLLQLDEIGEMLKRIKKSTSDALGNVTSVLMKIYSAAGGPCKVGGYVDPKRNFMLEQPHMVILGTTVIESFAQSLSREQLTDGFLSRTLLMHSESFPRQLEPEFKEIPLEILAAARDWLEYQPTKGNLAHVNPTPCVIPYSKAALEALEEFKVLCDQLTARHPLWSRGVEKAKKLAMNYEAALYGPPPGLREISKAAFLWGARLVEYVTRETLWIAGQWVADTQLETYTKKVIRWIRERKKRSLNEYTRAFQGIPEKTRQEVLRTLETSGQVSVAKVGNKTEIEWRLRTSLTSQERF